MAAIIDILLQKMLKRHEYHLGNQLNSGHFFSR